jgi:hypothetical protein
MDTQRTIRHRGTERLEKALGPGEAFGRHRLWSVPCRGGGPIKVWARPGLAEDLCRAWIFYPGSGDDRDAEEFRIQTQEQLEEFLRRVGGAALRGRGQPWGGFPQPGRDAGR